MKKATVMAVLATMFVLVPCLRGQDWSLGFTAPEPGRISLTAGFERMSQAFVINGWEERLRRDLFQARADFRVGNIFDLYGFIGTADFNGGQDSQKALAFGGGCRLLFLGEIVVEEKDERPMEVKLGAGLDLGVSRFKPGSRNLGPAAGLTQVHAGLDLGFSVMGIGGHIGFLFTRNLGALPYLAQATAAPATALNFSLALGLHYRVSRSLGLALRWTAFGLRSWGLGLGLSL